MPIAPQNLLGQVYLNAPGLWPLAALACAGMLAAVLLLYPAQLKQIGWPWRGLIPALRVAAIALLAVSALKPIAKRLATADERGAVLILVDRSRSMGVVDNTRTPAQLVALADAMGKLPPGVRSDPSTALAAELERLQTRAGDVRGAQEDLEYARVSGRDIPTRQRRLADAAQRYQQAAQALLDHGGSLNDADELVRQLAALGQPPDPQSREGWQTRLPEQIRQAGEALLEYQSDSDDRLYEMNADVRAACDSVAALSRFSLVEQALLRPGGIVERAHRDAAIAGFSVAGDVLPLPLLDGQGPVTALATTPDGADTDLTGGIARAVAGRPVRAVVLFSDGRQVSGDPTLVSGLAPEGAPVFTVAAAAPDAPRDVSFASVSAPSSVFAGQSFTVKAELRHDGFEGRSLEVHCQIGDEREQIRSLTLHDAKEAAVEFPLRAAAPGVQRVRLWFARVPGEASADNNVAQRWVKVVPERMKVLLVAGSPTWDFQFVRAALRELPEIQLRDVALDPNANARLNLSAAEVAGQDVIALFDVPAVALDDKRWDAVLRVARAAGGSVILVAGESHLPADYYRSPATAALLPFRAPYRAAWLTSPLEEPAFHFVPAPGAESLDLLKLPAKSVPAEPDAAPRLWEELPGCYRFLQLPETHDEVWKPAARPLMVEEESRLPVLTEMRLGVGRAFFVAFTESWRWRFKVGGRDQDFFWRQLVQHASEDPYFAHDGPLALDTDKVSAAPGEPIHIRARLTDQPAETLSTYKVDVYRDGKFVTDQLLTPTDAASLRFAATITLPAGDYELRWTVSGLGKTAHSVRIPLYVGSTGEQELADLSGDEKMLRKLAEASGGEFLTLPQVNRLPERLAAAGDSRSRYADLPLWDSPYLFGLVIGFLGVEWALRKHVGLA